MVGRSSKAFHRRLIAWSTQASASFAASVALNPRASNSHASLGKLQLQMGEVTGRHSNLGPTTDLQID